MCGVTANSTANNTNTCAEPSVNLGPTSNTAKSPSSPACSRGLAQRAKLALTLVIRVALAAGEGRCEEGGSLTVGGRCSGALATATPARACAADAATTAATAAAFPTATAATFALAADGSGREHRQHRRGDGSGEGRKGRRGTGGGREGREVRLRRPRSRASAPRSCGGWRGSWAALTCGRGSGTSPCAGFSRRAPPCRQSWSPGGRAGSRGRAPRCPWPRR